MANPNTTKYPFPATAPTSGQTINMLTISGKQANDVRRVVVAIETSHVSGTSGLTFDLLLDNETAVKTLVSYTVPALTAAVPFSVYDVAIPPGARQVQVNYVNSANTLTTWAGTIGAIIDERAAP